MTEAELYIPDIPITMKDSASLFPNNLSAWGVSGTQHYVVSSKGLVNIVIAKSGGTMQKQIPAKDCSHAQPVIQAKFVVIAGTLYLVMCTFRGIEIMNPSDQRQLLLHPLLPDPTKPGEEVFAQGVATLPNDNVAVGTSSGKILIFKRDSNAFTWSSALQGHNNPICDIQCNGKRLFTSDDNGCILVWDQISDKSGNSWDVTITYEGAGSPCSTLCVYKNYVIGGYGSGHIRIFDHNKGNMVAEITAHARWINAIDVNSNGFLASVSEDTIINIWDLNKITLYHSFTLPNVQMCGIQFLQGSDDFAVTGYDMKDIMIFRKSDK